MAYQIEYAYTCHIGKVRANNEDNFWCCGEKLEVENQGSRGVFTGSAVQSEMPLLAVFDGMGGESCGEMASYLAADSCGRYYQENKKVMEEEPEYFLQELCQTMNRAVCTYSRENKIRSMGTTAAVLGFGCDMIYACNLGDSRIYQVQGGRFHQISEDHVLGNVTFGKAPLTQYVGIPEESMILEPFIAGFAPDKGARYLLCSDGMTDMLSDGEIADILAREISVRETVEILLKRVLDKGGRDNVTIILCEIAERNKRGWIKRLFERLGLKNVKGMYNEKPDAGFGL